LGKRLFVWEFRSYQKAKLLRLSGKQRVFFLRPFLLNAIRNMPAPKVYHGRLLQGALIGRQQMGL
jgi:hypothetical protein